MKTNHTPGPWSRQYDTETDWSIVSIGKTIAQNNIEEIDTGNISKKENEANAKLIACAPEMLDILQMLALVHSAEKEQKLNGQNPKHWTNQLLNIIKKATE